MSVGDAPSLQADAFKKLYPQQYFARFFEDNVRPDGRTLGRSRATTIGLGAVSTADGSALVRIGHTAVLAGVNLQVARPDETTPDQGQLICNVESAAFSSADYRPGRPSELVSSVSERLKCILGCPCILPMQQLCIEAGKACWTATMDIYILNADGSVFDTALLAAVAALHDVVIPPVEVSDAGIRRQSSAPSHDQQGQRLALSSTPLSLTCCMFSSYVLADPTAEEEMIATSAVTAVVDGGGQIHGLYKLGGPVQATTPLLMRCIESSKLRYKELQGLLQQSLAAADAML